MGVCSVRHNYRIPVGILFATEFVSQLVHGEPPVGLRSFCKALLKAGLDGVYPSGTDHGCKGSSTPIQWLVLISLYRNLTLNQHRKGSAAATNFWFLLYTVNGARVANCKWFDCGQNETVASRFSPSLKGMG